MEVLEPLVHLLDLQLPFAEFQLPFLIGLLGSLAGDFCPLLVELALHLEAE